jgi:hypothetical protein
MKRTVIYTLLAAMPLLYSCGQNTEKSKEDTTAVTQDTVFKNECYSAVDSNDKAELKLRTMDGEEITGNLVINYFEKGKNDGVIKGKYHGDTLFVDYTFKIGTENPVVYKNPLAFLKQGDSLILGVGQIETSLGRSYFVKDKPIRFDRSKFIFGPVDCKE